MDRIIEAALGALVLASTATAQAQPAAPWAAPQATAAPPPAPTRDEITSRQVRLLSPQQPTPEGILAPEPPIDIAAPLLRRIIPGLAVGMVELPPFLRHPPRILHLPSSSF